MPQHTRMFASVHLELICFLVVQLRQCFAPLYAAVKIWLCRAEGCSARSSHSLVKAFWKPNNWEEPIPLYTPLQLLGHISSPSKVLRDSVEPVPRFASSVPLPLLHCRSLNISSSAVFSKIKITLSGQSNKTPMFPLLRKTLFPRLHCTTPSVSNWCCQVPSTFLTGFHALPSHRSFSASCSLR